MKSKKLYFFCVLILTGSLCLSQNETKKWYFGNQAGLDFMTNPPTILSNGVMNYLNATASIADATGNLLFYSNGATVWNQTHAVMANGTGLLGGSSDFQPVLIAKQPTNPNNYFIFTNNATSTLGLQYSTVDLSLAAGMGSVTTKNTLLAQNCLGALAGVKHCNGLDVWIVVHERLSNNFKAFLLSSAGLNTTAVISSVGTMSINPSPHGSHMKFSQNGKKLALNTLTNDHIALYDFDASTGLVTNEIILNASSGYYYHFGTEFSPDGTKLYAVSSSYGGFSQWDLCAGSATAIVASHYLQGTNIPQGQLQLAPNGKIYAARLNQAGLGIFHNPNGLGNACNYSYNPWQSLLPKTSSQGLPNFVSGFYNQGPPSPGFTFTVSNTFGCQTASFTPPPVVINNTILTCSSGFTLANYVWNFGDPASGISNTSTVTNPSHVFSSQGLYHVKLILNYSCGGGTDTLDQLLNVNLPCVSLASTSITCSSLGSATVTPLNGIGPFSYTWMPSGQTTSVVSGLGPGTYTITVFDAGNNVSATTTAVFTSLIPLTCSVSISNSITCFSANTGTGSVSNLAGGSGTQNYLWTNATTNYTTAFTNSLIAGNWSVTVTDALTACQVFSVFTITEPPASTLNIVANTPTTCVGTGIALTGTNSGGAAGYTYTWTNGPPINTNTVTEFIAGTYVYTLSSADANNCLTSNTISVDFIPNPVLSVSNASICPLTVGTLTALGTSSYTWSSTSLSLTGASFTASPLVNTQYTVIGSALGCTSVAYPSILLCPIPTPVLTSNSPRCNGQNLQLNASGGVLFNFDGPQSFVSNVQSPVINAVTPLNSGVYNLTVTSVNGCTASTSQTLTVNPTPSLSVAGATVCTSQTLNLNASSVAGATYLWNGAQNFSSTLQNPFINNPSVLASGNYSIKVLSPQNCSNTAIVNISVIPPPSLTSNLSGNGTLCAQALNGSPNTITLTAGGAATYTLVTPSYIVNNNPNGPVSPLTTIPPYPAGLSTATLTGSNGVCTAAKTVTFSVIPNPTVTVSSPTPVICAGQTFTYTNFGANSYTWGPGTPGLNTYTGPVTIASPTVTSVYSVIGGSLGCNSGTQTSTITVNPLPTVSISPKNPSICLGDKINLTALGNGTLFDWSPNLALNTTIGTVVSAGPVSQQTYQVMASLNSCTQIAVVTVSIIPLPEPEIILPRPRLCINDVITLIGKGGDTYNWTAPNNLLYAGQTVSFVAHSLTYGGTYILNVIDGNNCKNKTTADLIVDDLPYGSLIPSSKYNCVPFTSEFVFDSHTKPTTYWTLENSTYTGTKFSHLFTVPGEYLITGRLQDTNTNCVNTLTILVNAYPIPKADFKFLPEKPVESLEPVIFTNNSTGEFQTKWNWSFIANNGFKSSNENTSYFFQDAGLYPVAFIVQNKYGCSDTIVKTIKVESDFNIYVPNAFTPNGDELNDIFLPVLRGAKFYTLSIFDRWGAKLFETNTTEAGWDGSYRGEDAKQDVYVWKISVSSNSGEQKILTGQVTLTR